MDEGRLVVVTLANILSNTVSLGKPSRVTCFDSVSPPDVSLQSYFVRLFEHLRCSPECFVHALVYLDRFAELNPDCALSRTNVHRLFLTATVVALKYFDDVTGKNTVYARIGGITVRELNALEGRFLCMINWRAYVSQEDFRKGLAAIRACRGRRIVKPGSTGRTVAAQHCSSFAAQAPSDAESDAPQALETPQAQDSDVLHTLSFRSAPALGRHPAPSKSRSATLRRFMRQIVGLRGPGA